MFRPYWGSSVMCTVTRLLKQKCNAQRGVEPGSEDVIHCKLTSNELLVVLQDEIVEQSTETMNTSGASENNQQSNNVNVLRTQRQDS